jgi:hypothetical protein
MSNKTCIKCGIEKPLNEFELGRNACKECRKEYHKTNQIARRWKYQNKYGITLEDYDEMLSQQNGCCAICGANDPGGPGKRFVVDHNHQTEEVRGLLCNSCNRALGYFQDSPSILSKALNYLYTNGYYGKI